MGVVLAGPAVPSVTGECAATKPYGSFTEFYPHYRREHSRTATRALHVFGTAMVQTLALFNPALLPAALAAGATGMLLSPALCGLPHGLIEGAAVMVLFVLLAHRGGATKAVR